MPRRRKPSRAIRWRGQEEDAGEAELYKEDAKKAAEMELFWRERMVVNGLGSRGYTTAFNQAMYWQALGRQAAQMYVIHQPSAGCA